MTHRILLCDDEVHILRAAEFKFKRAGYEVFCASDGEEGWQMLQQHAPDAVVTDYQMPRLDGLGLIERMRSHESTAEIPVVLLTAKGFELPRQRLIEKWRLANVLSKPFSPRKLLACVEEVLPAASTPTGDVQP